MTRSLALPLLAGLAIGCSKGIPTFETLSIPQPLFSGATTRNQVVPDPNSLIPVIGTCDATLTTIEFRVTSAGAWGPASAIADGGTATVDCASTGFAFNLPSLATLGINTSTSVTVSLEARGVLGTEYSATSRLNLQFSAPGGIKAISRLTQGGAAATSPSFRIEGSLNFRSPGQASSPSLSVTPKTK